MFLLQSAVALTLLVAAQAFGIANLDRHAMRIKRDSAICDGKMIDLVFVMDESGSITTAKYNSLKQYIEAVVGGLNVDGDDVRVGLIRYASGATVAAALNDNINDAAGFIATVQGLSKMTGASNLWAAIPLIESAFTSVNGGRGGDTCQVAVVLTDGGWSHASTYTNGLIADLIADNPELSIFPIWCEPECSTSGTLPLLATDPDNLLCIDLANQGPTVDALYDGICDVPCVPDCMNDGTCTAGTCACTPMFQGPSCESMINPCASNPCKNGGSCSTISTPFSCICPPGFSGTFCTDEVDPCSPSPCLPAASCSPNGEGFGCTCPDGYEGDGVSSCADIDECALNLCGLNSECVNTPGSFKCACQNGFFSVAENSCSRSNPCEASPGPCDQVTEECQSSGFGDFQCVCAQGYIEQGEVCVDDNECDDVDICPSNQRCLNTVGSFVCYCPFGFTLSGSTCNDNNECGSTPYPCGDNTDCSNSPGSFTCACKPDFTGDPYTDCTAINYCGPAARAINYCGPAANGYVCDEDAVCDITSCGTDCSIYECGCKTGYEGDGLDCVVPCPIKRVR